MKKKIDELKKYTSKELEEITGIPKRTCERYKYDGVPEGKTKIIKMSIELYETRKK